MAKSRPEAPGTSTRGGVCTTMDAPFKKASMGSQQNMTGTFDKPRSGGANGLPTKTYDSLGGPSSTPKPGFAATAPSQQGPRRPGQR